MRRPRCGFYSMFLFVELLFAVHNFTSSNSLKSTSHRAYRVVIISVCCFRPFAPTQNETNFIAVLHTQQQHTKWKIVMDQKSFGIVWLWLWCYRRMSFNRWGCCGFRIYVFVSQNIYDLFDKSFHVQSCRWICLCWTTSTTLRYVRVLIVIYGQISHKTLNTKKNHKILFRALARTFWSPAERDQF